MIREFYVNYMPFEGEDFSLTPMVRGRIIQFNINSISEYFGNPMIVRECGLYPYGKSLHIKFNIEDIYTTILIEGRSVQLNALGVPIRYQSDNLSPVA